MELYLKEVQMENFKSFGKKFTVPFFPGFTAITGPNGAGKSNIADAILFVLGPKSSKVMRAGRLTDLIFNGGKKHKNPAKYCKVSLVFDNTKRRMPVDSEEVILTRMIKRAPLKKDPPDVIYMVSYLKDAALLVKTIRDSKLNSLLVGGAGGFTSQKFIDNAGDHANHLLTATLWTPSLKYPGTKAYYDQYNKKYASPPDYHGAEAYSALLVVADVLKRADSYRPESIRAALDDTDLITPFGPVKFTSYEKFERQNSLPTQVLQIIDGKFECVWPQEHASSNFIQPSYWRASD